MAILVPLFSGSTGNSYYIGEKDHGILIDAGRSCKQISEALNGCGISPTAVRGIFVTHEHSDHISGIKVLAGKYNIPVFTRKGTADELDRMGILTGKFPLYLIESGIETAGLKIQSFATSHDCADSCGFRVTAENGTVISLATDLGEITDEVRNGVSGSDFLIIESNHDVGMLMAGPYPYMLKKRILSGSGHLSNDSCADFLPWLIRSGTRKFLLAHLSRENNTPELAYQTAVCSLSMNGFEAGRDYAMAVAPVENSSRKIINI